MNIFSAPLDNASHEGIVAVLQGSPIFEASFTAFTALEGNGSKTRWEFAAAVLEPLTGHGMRDDLPALGSERVPVHSGKEVDRPHHFKFIRTDDQREKLSKVFLPAGPVVFVARAVLQPSPEQRHNSGLMLCAFFARSLDFFLGNDFHGVGSPLVCFRGHPIYAHNRVRQQC